MLKPSQPSWRRALLLVPLAILPAVSAAPAAGEPAPEENVFRSNTDEVYRGAATLAGAGCQGGAGTAMVLGMLVRGNELHLWRLEESNKALDLTPSLLRRVKDSSDVRVDDSAFEPEAYCEAVLKSSLVSLGAFANSAYTDVTFTDVFTEPTTWRGKVVHYEGTIRSIRRFDAPLMLRGKGIKDLYECWIFRKDDGSNRPVCLVCTELPESVKPGERLSLEVSFDAYFFKRYRYEAVGSKPGTAREAPLFIGRGFVVPRQPEGTSEASDTGAKTFLIGFLGLVCATFVLAFGLHFWFRHGDRRVQARIKQARARDYADPGLPESPGPPPSAN
jgi:hypothetical protein